MAPSAFLGIWVLLVSTWAVPLVAGGSATQPEITDPEGDVETLQFPAATPDTAGALDIVAAWFDAETNESFNATLAVVDLSRIDVAVPPGARSYVFQVWFAINGSTTSVTAAAHYAESTAAWRFEVVPYNRATAQWGTPQDVLGRGDVEASTITIVVPRSALGGPSAGWWLERLGAHASCGCPTAPLSQADDAEAPAGTRFVFLLDSGDLGAPTGLDVEGSGGAPGALPWSSVTATALAALGVAGWWRRKVRY